MNCKNDCSCCKIKKERSIKIKEGINKVINIVVYALLLLGGFTSFLVFMSVSIKAQTVGAAQSSMLMGFWSGMVIVYMAVRYANEFRK